MWEVLRRQQLQREEGNIVFDWKGVQGQIVAGVVVAVVIGGGSLIWNWASKGGLVHALGGTTLEEVQAAIKQATIAGPAGPAGPPGPKGVPGDTAGFPVGVVAAFDLPEGCPTAYGWTTFKPATGRVILGAYGEYEVAMQADPLGRPLTARKYREHGGEEQHQLTISQIPAHDHAIQVVTHGEFQEKNGEPNSAVISVGRAEPGTNTNQPLRFTEAVGGGQPFNAMQPFVALYYCKKD
jgi:hypothetical protein